MALFETVFMALNEAAVRYVVVGGLAVVLHGHARMTADVDLVLDLSPDEARKALAVFEALGLRPRAPVSILDFAVAANRKRWFEEKGMRVFSLHDPRVALSEFALFIECPIDFEQLWSRSMLMPLSGTAVRIASIPHLRIMDQDPCGVGWEDRRRQQLTLGLSATPAERLAWLEEILRLAHDTGALPRPRDPWTGLRS